MGGKRGNSVLKKKMADWWWRQEVSPQVAAVMSEVQMKVNYGKWKEVEEHLKKLEEEAKKEVDGKVVKLEVSRMYKEEEKKFRRRAFYDALYPIVLEYRFMPLQAVFIWYLKALKLVYGDKPPADLLNVLRSWIRGWLSGGCTKEVEEKVKASIIGWLIGKY